MTARLSSLGAWQLGVSIGLCGLLLWLLDWEKVQELLISSDPYWLLIAFFFMHVDRLFMAIKWHMLLMAAGFQVPKLVAVQAYYVGSLWSCVLPFVGGDVVRNLWLFKRIGYGEQIASTIVIERLYGFLALGCVAIASFLIGMMYFRIESEQLPLAGMLALLFLISFISIKILFNEKIHVLADKIIEKIPIHKLVQSLGKLRIAILEFRDDLGTLQRFLALSIIENIFPIIILYTLSEAYEIDLPFAWAIIGMPMILAISRVPISMDGLGLTEGAYAFVFSLAGLSVSESVVIAVTARMLLILSALPGILFSGSISSLLRAEPIVSSDATISKNHGH